MALNTCNNEKLSVEDVEVQKTEQKCKHKSMGVRKGLFLAQQWSMVFNITRRIGRTKSKDVCSQTSYRINVGDSDRSLGEKGNKKPQIIDSLE